MTRLSELRLKRSQLTYCARIVTNKPTVAASSQARLSTGLAEVAVAPCPDSSGPPVFGHRESDVGIGCGFPSN